MQKECVSHISDDDYDNNDQGDMYDAALINLITNVPNFMLDMYPRDRCGLNLLFLNFFNIQTCVSFSNGKGYVVLQQMFLNLSCLMF
jgi:hypothetical protein